MIPTNCPQFSKNYKFEILKVVISVSLNTSRIGHYAPAHVNELKNIKIAELIVLKGTIDPCVL
jgi:hypothetical protein